MRGIDRILDEWLVLLAREGRRDALERLAARWRPRHYVHARRLLGAADGAADAVQEAWLGILRGLPRLRDPARFPAWSYAIVTRRCRDLQRRADRTRPSGLDVEDLAGDKPPDDARDLRRALHALPPAQRATLALFYREGLTVTEVAEALCIPAGTVKTRLLHARRTLRRRLEGDDT